MSGLGWKCGCKGNRKLWIDKIKAIICNLYSPYSLQSVSKPRCVDWSVLAEFYLCDVLLLVAVVAFHDTFSLSTKLNIVDIGSLLVMHFGLLHFTMPLSSLGVSTIFFSTTS